MVLACTVVVVGRVVLEVVSCSVVVVVRGVLEVVRCVVVVDVVEAEFEVVLVMVSKK